MYFWEWQNWTTYKQLKKKQLSITPKILIKKYCYTEYSQVKTGCSKTLIRILISPVIS